MDKEFYNYKSRHGNIQAGQLYFGLSDGPFGVGLYRGYFLYTLYIILYMLPQIILPMLAGPLIDKISRRKMSCNIRISATQSHVPDEGRGRFNGTFQMLNTFGTLSRSACRSV